MAADYLALLTHRLYRRSYLHGPFRLMIQTGWLWRPVRPPLPCPGAVTRRSLPAPSATAEDSKATVPTGPHATRPLGRDSGAPRVLRSGARHGGSHAARGLRADRHPR